MAQCQGLQPALAGFVPEHFGLGQWCVLGFAGACFDCGKVVGEVVVAVMAVVSGWRGWWIGGVGGGGCLRFRK